MKKERLFYLDLIRAISTIFVIIYHFNIHLGLWEINGDMIFKFIPNDYFRMSGVSLFIIISGACLMYTNHEKFKTKNFFVKRFWAIYPTFWTGYFMAFLFTFYVNKTTIHLPKWRFIFTILGVDGYFSKVIPNFYLVGEWFLGFIIIFYLVYPILRKFTIEKPKILAVFITIIYVFSIKLNIEGFNVLQFSDLFSRLPEILFGMYFIYYIKKVNIYQFIGALCVMLFFMLNPLNINLIFKTTIIGISSFIVLVYIGQKINSENKKVIFSFISKYSFPSIIANQLVMVYIMKSFSGHTISRSESYLLFFIVYIVITTTAILISKISSKVVMIFRKPNVLPQVRE